MHASVYKCVKSLEGIQRLLNSPFLKGTPKYINATLHFDFFKS